MKILCYASDAVFLAENEDDLQQLQHRLELGGEIFNMQIVREKTDSTLIAEEPIRCKVAINKPIQSVQCNYLGIQIKSRKNQQQEALTQANKASIISGCSRDLQ